MVGRGGTAYRVTITVRSSPLPIFLFLAWSCAVVPHFYYFALCINEHQSGASALAALVLCATVDGLAGAQRSASFAGKKCVHRHHLLARFCNVFALHRLSWFLTLVCIKSWLGFSGGDCLCILV